MSQNVICNAAAKQDDGFDRDLRSVQVLRGLHFLNVVLNTLCATWAWTLEVYKRIIFGAGGVQWFRY